MYTQTVDIPRHEITVGTCNIHPETVIIPATKHTYAPTLAKVHNWLWGDCGPIALSWQTGLLCPFDDRIHRMNITCSEGARSQCGGLLVTPHNAPYPPTGRQRLIGRVVCFRWNNLLGNAYWDIPNAELLALPDDVCLVAHYIMHRIFRVTGWVDWRRELRQRQNGKRQRAWLHPLARF